MKGVTALFLGIFGTFAFSWAGLTLIPNWQIGHLDPQMDEEQTDIYPMPRSGMAERGRKVYAANGCVYCHSQQVRADYAASDIERKWGTRRSAPRDYIFDRPALLGKERMGPDLSNIGKRAPAEDANAAPPAPTSPAPSAAPGTSPAANPPQPNAAPSNPPATTKAAPSASASAIPANSPAPAVTSADTTTSPAGMPPQYSAAWHHLHLYTPRSVLAGSTSNMPSYKFLYDTRQISGERSADALKLTGPNAPEEGWEIVPSYDAKCLVAYLLSLDQSHELQEAKLTTTSAPASSPAPATSPAAPATSPAPAKEEKK
jgi:cbb3-type cytochrome oxidase cytochrome c subunit